MTHYETDKTLMDYYIGGFRKYFKIGDSFECLKGDYIKRSIEVDVWQRRDFYNALESNPEVIQDGGWALYCLVPDPYLYYYRHFAVFPLIVSRTIENAEQYLIAISEDPGGSPADAIAYRAEKTVVASKFGSAVFLFDEANDSAIALVATQPRPFEQLR